MKTESRVYATALGRFSLCLRAPTTVSNVEEDSSVGCSGRLFTLTEHLQIPAQWKFRFFYKRIKKSVSMLRLCVYFQEARGCQPTVVLTLTGIIMEGNWPFQTGKKESLCSLSCQQN